MDENEKSIEEIVKDTQDNQEIISSDNEQNAQKDELPTIIDEIKQSYEKKITDIVTKKDKEIKERDNVIKQLLSDDNTAVVPSIAEKINSKRNFKKW